MNPRYEIQGQLGEGGEASVWKAWDTRLQRYVAIKRLLPTSQREVPDAGDIFAEASALSALQHPNIVSVFDVEADKEIGPYVVMEFLNGENLEQTIQRGALTKNDFCAISTQVLEGLVAAHKMGVQHRDIKPSNIMLNWLPDQRFIAKVLDFGLAKFTTRPLQQTVKTGNKILGSIFFMAPEQFSHRPLDYRSDLYSLGCVLYYALTTRYPFAGETPSQVIQSHLDHMVTPLRDVRPDIPPLLCDWVMWLLRRQPEHRPRDAAQALEIFRGLLDGSILEIPQSVTGLRTTTVMPTRSVPTAGAHKAAAVAPKTSGSLRKWLWPALALLPVAGAAIFFLTRQGEDGAGSDKTKPSLPAGLTPPPQEGLVIWMDPARGTFKDEGHTAAGVGDQIAYWADQAAQGGANVFNYTRTVRLNPEERWPILVERANEGGLKGTHRLLKFDGGDNLVLRDADELGSPITPHLDGGQLTCLIIFRRSDGLVGTREYLLSAEKDKTAHDWGAYVENDGASSGGSKDQAGPSRLPLKNGFGILSYTLDSKAGVCQQWLTGADGQSVTATGGCPIETAPLKLLRLGAIAHTRMPEGPQNGYFNGEIGEVLLYDRVLSESDLHAARNYLCQRYFGCAAAAATAPANVPPAPASLAVWLDAAKGTLDKEGKEISSAHRHIWTWKSQATPLGGPLSFTAPPDKLENHDQAAKLEEVTDENGLKGRHRVLRFSGFDNYALAPQENPPIKLAGGSLDQNQLTVCVMTRLKSGPTYNRLICAKMGDEPKAWDLGLDQGNIQGGVRLPDGKSNKSSIRFDGRDSFAALCLTWDGAAGQAQLWLQKPDGTVETGKQIPAKFDHGPLRQLRIGGTAEFTVLKEADFFSGDIAEILIYNRPLTDAERTAALSYLSQRYFGG